MLEFQLQSAGVCLCSFVLKIAVPCISVASMANKVWAKGTLRPARWGTITEFQRKRYAASAEELRQQALDLRDKTDERGGAW